MHIEADLGVGLTFWLPPTFAFVFFVLPYIRWTAFVVHATKLLRLSHAFTGQDGLSNPSARGGKAGVVVGASITGAAKDRANRNAALIAAAKSARVARERERLASRLRARARAKDRARSKGGRRFGLGFVGGRQGKDGLLSSSNGRLSSAGLSVFSSVIEPAQDLIRGAVGQKAVSRIAAGAKAVRKGLANVGVLPAPNAGSKRGFFFLRQT